MKGNATAESIITSNSFFLKDFENKLFICHLLHKIVNSFTVTFEYP